MTMQVVILAGGLGTRLLPLTKEVPKALIPVCGRPFLEYQLNWLSRHGLNNVVLCVGYLADKIEAFAHDGRAFGLQIIYSREDGDLVGTGGALRKAGTLLQDEFCVLNGDSYLPINPLDPIDHFRKNRFTAMILTLRNQNLYGKSNTTVENGLVTFYEKEGGKPGLEFIDYGMQMFRKEVLRLIPRDCFCDMGDLYGRLIREKTLVSYVVSEPFYEIGSVRGLERFKRYLAEEKNYNL
jgi:NDP-sugar pyrophosphorylase family protein